MPSNVRMALGTFLVQAWEAEPGERSRELGAGTGSRCHNLTGLQAIYYNDPQARMAGCARKLPCCEIYCLCCLRKVIQYGMGKDAERGAIGGARAHLQRRRRTPPCADSTSSRRHPSEDSRISRPHFFRQVVEEGHGVASRLRELCFFSQYAQRGHNRF